jgi:ParB family chromosome partitioning protein
VELITIDPSHVLVRDGLERIRKEKGNINELLESIKSKGQIHPILVTRNSDGSINLVAGERRLLACSVGKILVNCVVRESMTNLELRELELEENIQRKDFTWQERTMGISELHKLKQLMYGEATGGRSSQGHSLSDTADIAGITKQRVHQAIQLAKAMEAIPELALAKTEKDATKVLAKLEEKILIDELAKRQRRNESPALFASAHFIIQDAFEGLSKVPSASADFANVDTPYGINLTSVKKMQSGVRTDADYTEWNEEEFGNNAAITMQETYRALKPSAFMLWWFGIQRYTQLKTMLESVGFIVDPIPGIWFGGAGGAQCNQPETTLARSYDTFFMCRKGSPVLVKRGRANVFCFDKVAPQHKIHPTEKPLELMKELFSLFLLPGMKCLSPFLGSGNDLRAMYYHKATGFGFELDENLKNKFMLRVEEDINNKAYGDYSEGNTAS